MGDQRNGGSDPIRLITADELGLLKGSLVAVARRSGKIDVLGTDAGALQGTAPAVPWEPDMASQSRQVTGLSFLSHDAVTSPRLVSCTRGGCLRVHEAAGTGSPEEPVVTSWPAATSWAVSKEVCAMAVSPHATEAAVGTQGTSHLSVWDLATQQKLYQAKGAKPNAIGLVDKPWDATVAYLVGDEGCRVAVGTGYHKVRVYDVKAQRRPVMEVSFGESRVTALTPDLDGNRVWAGNAVGDVRALDLRVGRLQEGLKGSQGSVRALTTHPSLPLLASAGLDRFLRVYHTGTRALVAKVYLKQALTAVQFCTPAGVPGTEEGGAGADPEERESERNAEEKGDGEEREDEGDEEADVEDKYGDLEVLMTGDLESDVEERAVDVRSVGGRDREGGSRGKERQGEIRREKRKVPRDRQGKSDKKAPKEGRKGGDKKAGVVKEVTGSEQGAPKSKGRHGKGQEPKTKSKRQKRIILED